MNQEELAELFRRLGAPDPDGWARSQVSEGVPQLARYLFLRQAWREVVCEDDPSWISRAIDDAQAWPTDPYAGVGHAPAKLRERGATDAELTDLVRGMQAKLLFSLCYLLEDPGDLEPEISHIRWNLAQVDETDAVIGRIEGLHESVLETDPTGREMRPRSSGD
jgi:hypothetical protein